MQNLAQKSNSSKIKLNEAVLSCNKELDKFYIEDYKTYSCNSINRSSSIKSFGAVTDKYIKARKDEQIEYWVKTFSELKNLVIISLNQEELVKNYINIRTQFEDLVLGEKCYFLPRYDTEEFDDDLKVYLDQLITEHCGCSNPWFRDTARYWNYEQKKGKNEPYEHIIRIQNMSGPDFSGKYDNLLLSLDFDQLKNNGEYEFLFNDYKSILQLANYTSLLLNHVNKLEENLAVLKSKALNK